MFRRLKTNTPTWMVLSVLMIPALLLFVHTAEARTWTDTKGRNIEAEISRVEGDTVIVKKDGKDVRLPLAMLSEQDKQFVSKWTTESKAVKATVATPPNKAEAKEAVPSGKISANESAYYTSATPSLFLPFPDVTDKKPWVVRNFGPVGIGISLVRPSMTMEINNVEKGSPAEKTNKLKQGQIIESINGKVLKEIDPRIILGDIITEAEATDGKVVLKLKDEGDVVVNIPVFGSYSKTWPVDCPKSDKIVRNLADLLAKDNNPQRWGSILFLLSTGEEKDLEVVRRWMKDFKKVEGINWHRGMVGPGICEYYLRTGDQNVLPVIKEMTDKLQSHMYSGGWAMREGPGSFTYSTGSGQLHAAGVHCMTLLVMAKLCGVEVDDRTFNQSFAQFYRFAGHGNVAYGNGPPEGGFRDNGKTSGLGLTLGAAALLSPEGEASVFAKARDNTAAKAFYATNWFHASHTGGGLGEIWHHAATSQVREKRPASYRSYLDTRRWVMDLSRRFDGSIGIAGMDDRYDRSATEDFMAWGTYFALTYTYPRKQLQLFGAPRSKWAKTTPLPRPWGNAADDAFHSIEPIAGGPLTMEDLLNEKVETGASLAVFAKLSDPALTDQTLLKYIYHPEYEFRSAAMDQVTRRGRADLVLPLLQSTDPRLRQSGLLALTGMFKGKPLPANLITPEMWGLTGKMLNDPNESWWGVQHAIEAIGLGSPELIAKHRDRLLEFLGHDCVWVQTAAVCALAKIAVDPAHYKTVLPAIIERTSAFRVDSASYRSSYAISEVMKTASSEVKDFATPLLKNTYASIPDMIAEPYNGAVLNNCAKTVRSRIASILQLLPGGEEFVMQMPKTTLVSYISGKASDMYTFSGTHTPNKEVIGTWSWAIYPPPNKPEDIDPFIDKYLAWKNSAKGSATKEGPKEMIEFREKGNLAKSVYFRGYFWTGNMLIGTHDDQALKIEIRKRGGRDFLIVERGGFQTPPDVDEVQVAKDWHCGYHVYVRQE